VPLTGFHHDHLDLRNGGGAGGPVPNDMLLFPLRLALSLVSMTRPCAPWFAQTLVIMQAVPQHQSPPADIGAAQDAKFRIVESCRSSLSPGLEKRPLRRQSTLFRKFRVWTLQSLLAELSKMGFDALSSLSIMAPFVHPGWYTNHDLLCRKKRIF